jgi:hypothetical protein
MTQQMSQPESPAARTGEAAKTNQVTLTEVFNVTMPTWRLLLNAARELLHVGYDPYKGSFAERPISINPADIVKVKEIQKMNGSYWPNLYSFYVGTLVFTNSGGDEPLRIKEDLSALRWITDLPLEANWTGTIHLKDGVCSAPPLPPRGTGCCP